MPKRKVKVIVDTNWWVSFAMNPTKSQMASLLLDDAIEFVGSAELQDEVLSVINRPELARYFSGNALRELKGIFLKSVAIQVVTSEVEVCRDPKDNFLLALCRDAKADFLITGDKDLLSLRRFENTAILSMTEFLSL
ncbi:MAG: putative toxin-antitoxin system toxin component, PIN family [Saprospiraceae bacterium]